MKCNGNKNMSFKEKIELYLKYEEELIESQECLRESQEQLRKTHEAQFARPWKLVLPVCSYVQKYAHPILPPVSQASRLM